MTNYPALLSVDDLKSQLSDPNFQVVQVVSQTPFSNVFIPGAAVVSPQELVSGRPPTPGELPSVERLNKTLGRIGLDDKKTIVVADDEGGAWAGRLAWTLDAVGHTRWCYLNGGIHAWIAAGEEITSTPTLPTPVQLNLTINNERRVELNELVGELNNSDVLIWDCRTRDEYVGIRNTAQRNGHIPGAVHLNWLDLVDASNNMQIAADAVEQLANLKIVSEKSLVVHCQTHHRSGFTYMLARLLDFPRVRAYAGSWAEWGNHPNTPVIQGET